MSDARQNDQAGNRTSGQDDGEERPRQQGGDEPASALGGGTATRSSTAEGPDPAEAQE
ncbi:hypothetical protein [Sphingomonas parva]|uniref:hypothetical protein n=1 Tax=Sphingomonas parva TaxID=2555898 RepID=UPI001432123E|nr:hypothetical protein [Sphingomonas parva]